jgi:thiol-disulfide isomerase/thioredoxin
MACWLPVTCVSGASTYETDYPVELSLPQLNGPTVSLSALRGQWVVLNYWATWCAPCREEIPELSELHDTRADVTVLGLAYEEAEPADFDEFLQELHTSYPILLVDVYAPPKPFGPPRVLPTTIILDPRGHAVKGFAGPVTRVLLEAFIDGSASQ